MIARDHNWTDAGLAAFANGHSHFRARRVDHARQTGEDQVRFWITLVALRRILAHRQAKHAQRLLRHPRIDFQNLLASLIVKRYALAIFQFLSATLENDLRRTFRE